MGDNGHTANHQWVQAALEQFEAPLVRYAARLTGDAEAARDVVQETFVRLCGQRPDRLDGHLAAWLFTVCRRRALDVRRKEGRNGTLSLAVEESLTCERPTPDEAAQRRERAQQLQTFIKTLPPAQQEVVRLKFQNGLSYKDIARVMNIGVSNVGFLLHVAIRKLRQQPWDRGDASPPVRRSDVR